MIKYVFLDLDDTVLDFHKAEEVAIQKTLRHFGVTPTEKTVARYSAINQAQWKLLEQGKLTRTEVKLRRFSLLFEELGVQIDAEAARTFYEETLSHGHYFIAGAEQLLQDLCKDYALYIASNGTTAVQNGRIASAGIAHYFEEIFLSEQIGAVKPTKAFFDHCFARIPQFDRHEAIILGDSLTSDIQGGIHAGIKTCWFNPKGACAGGEVRPDFEISALEEFLPLLKSL